MRDGSPSAWGMTLESDDLKVNTCQNIEKMALSYCETYCLTYCETCFPSAPLLSHLPRNLWRFGSHVLPTVVDRISSPSINFSELALPLCCAKFKNRDNEKIGICGHHKSSHTSYKPKADAGLKTETALARGALTSWKNGGCVCRLCGLSAFEARNFCGSDLLEDWTGIQLGSLC